MALPPARFGPQRPRIYYQSIFFKLKKHTPVNPRAGLSTWALFWGNDVSEAQRSATEYLR
jgi:hypothetical protein